LATLGVLSCQILELEFSYILANDSDISEIIVMDNEFSQGLIEALKKRTGSTPRLVSAFGEYFRQDNSGLTVLVNILDVGLHIVIKHLQEGVVKASKEMSPHVDGIMLGYGMCGNALTNPEELLRNEGVRVPVFIPMDEGHPVDDCVGLLIGGREIYYAEQCNIAGTMFMTPGFTRHWKTIMIKGNREGKLDWKISKRLFKHFERNLFLTTPVLSKETMVENVKEFNQHHGFRNEIRQGTLDLLLSTWKTAKKSIGGNVDSCAENYKTTIRGN